MRKLRAQRRLRTPIENRVLQALSKLVGNVVARQPTPAIQHMNGLEFPCIMGNRSGVVEVNTNQIVYVQDLTTGQVLEVVNNKVPNIPGRLVYVGVLPEEPNLLQVLRMPSKLIYPYDTIKPSIPSHAELHTFPNLDAVYVDAPQIIPFLVVPDSSGNFIVKIFGGSYLKTTGEPATLKTQLKDISSYQPSSGAVYILLQFNDAGTVSVLEGTTVENKGDLTIPTPTEHVLAGVRLYDGQERVRRDGEINDIVDFRFAPVNLSVVAHNGLSGIQGGTVDQYYHLTAADYTALVTDGYAGSLHYHKYVSLMWEPTGSMGWEFMYDDPTPDEPLWELKNTE